MDTVGAPSPPTRKIPPGTLPRNAKLLMEPTVLGEFRVGVKDNLPPPPNCLQGSTWGVFSMAGTLTVTDTTDEMLIAILQEDGVQLVSTSAVNVLDTVDSARYFILPGPNKSFYVGAAFYTSEDAVTFRGLTDKIRKNPPATPTPPVSKSKIFKVTPGPKPASVAAAYAAVSSNNAPAATSSLPPAAGGSGSISTSPSSPGPSASASARPMPASVKKSASNLTLPKPSSSAVTTPSLNSSSLSIQSSTPIVPYKGGDFKKLEVPHFEDEVLSVYEKTLQLSYANVYRCSLGPLPCAVKVFLKAEERIVQSCKQGDSGSIREKHPNILRFFGCQYAEGMFSCFYEYCGRGTVWDLMYYRKTINTPFSAQEVSHYALGVAKALAHLHANNTPHRDIKSSNVFLDGEEEPYSVVKLGDPPELTIPSNSVDPLPADVWQFGMYLVELVTLSPPYDGDDDAQKNIQAGKLPNIPSNSFMTLIKACLKTTPSERYTAAQIVKHLNP